MADAFDLVVLGGGTGGYSAALRAAALGKSVALVERGKVGGTCLHIGCIPTKALLHAAEVYDTARDGERILTSDEALGAPVPKSAIVLGAGSVGVEFASVWASFGAEVTVVEMLPGLVPLEDADLGKELARAFKKRSIRALTGAKLEEAQ